MTMFDELKFKIFNNLISSGDIIIGKDLDLMFNSIVNHLNEKIVTAVNNITFKRLKGDVSYINTVFMFYDSGKSKFDFISDLNINDDTISLNKINTSTLLDNSILISDNTGAIISKNTNLPNSILSFDGSITFKYLNNFDITSAGIKINGNKFYNISLNNLKVGETLLPSKYITSNILKNVANDKIADNQIDFRHIGVFENLPYSNALETQLLLDDFDDNSITINKIKDNTISVDLHVDSIKPFNSGNTKLYSIDDTYFYKQYIVNSSGNLESTLRNHGTQIINLPSQQLHNVKLNINHVDDTKKLTRNEFIKVFSTDVMVAVDNVIAIVNKERNPPPQPVVNDTKAKIIKTNWFVLSGYALYSNKVIKILDIVDTISILIVGNIKSGVVYYILKDGKYVPFFDNILSAVINKDRENKSIKLVTLNPFSPKYETAIFYSIEKEVEIKIRDFMKTTIHQYGEPSNYRYPDFANKYFKKYPILTESNVGQTINVPD